MGARSAVSDILTATERAFLEQRHWAVLGTLNPNGSPQLSVMWFLLEGDEILFNTAAGRRKVDNLARDPRASLAVYDEATPMRYLVMSGRVRRIDGLAAARADFLRLARRYLTDPRALAERAAAVANEERISYRLRIRRTRSRL